MNSYCDLYNDLEEKKEFKLNGEHDVKQINRFRNL